MTEYVLVYIPGGFMPAFLDSKQAAALVGLAPNTLAKLRVAGGGPEYRKIGSRVIYTEADLVRWLESHPRRRSTADTPMPDG